MGWNFLIIGPVILVMLVLFVVLVYRLAGIRPSPLERRRLVVQFALLAVVVVALSLLSALGAPGAQLYWVPVAAAAYLGVRQLQKSGHWLVTPTPEELAAVPARRQAMAAVFRRPAFWLLAAGLLVGFVAITIVVAIVQR